MVCSKISGVTKYIHRNALIVQYIFHHIPFYDDAPGMVL